MDSTWREVWVGSRGTQELRKQDCGVQDVGAWDLATWDPKPAMDA